MISPAKQSEPSPKSPFPGMDPWVEESWGDMHTRLTTYASDALQPQLPPGLRARVEEYMAIVAADLPGVSSELRQPDVSVVETSPTTSYQSAAAIASQSAVAIEDEPLLLSRFTDPPTLRKIEIVDTRHGNQLITSIEFLSPTNKQRLGRESFRQKQNLMIQGGVNIVEIDLLRCGDWSVSIPHDAVPTSRRGTYRVCVVRAVAPGVCEYYPIALNHRLPNIRIPLRANDDDVMLGLQRLFEQGYRNGAYDTEIDYTSELATALNHDEATIAQSILAAARSLTR